MKLIDADTVVHWQSYDDEHETYPEYTGTIAEFLDQMTDEGCPEAMDAVPVRHGRWVHHPEIGWGSTWLCSECGEKTVETIMGEPRYKFCPMCGARMDGKNGDHETD